MWHSFSSSKRSAMCSRHDICFNDWSNFWRKCRTNLDVVVGDPVVEVRNVQLSPSFNAQGPDRRRQNLRHILVQITLPYTLGSLASKLLQTQRCKVHQSRNHQRREALQTWRHIYTHNTQVPETTQMGGAQIRASWDLVILMEEKSFHQSSLPCHRRKR